ncbi:response regulator [Pseudomonas aeruginosa]|uniref:response regulator n=1 Tax=Pseudomonas aeruginosa TaxID=287 RepID=UPI00053E9A4D|nr:response regulator [Pseudomonas aeruginosa]EKX8761567.1 response regulator transcription factor [Pseudomonas aeruginosa]POP60451.1 DNA-binding response regulator [Pseudomonas aeruginosa]HCF9840547.1 response regulator transcription factor [Pseudomonas aeruginosa]
MSQQRILIVEDDIDSAEVMAAYLKRDNFQTQHAADGKQALELHARWRPDLVLLDIMLPGLSGNEVLGAIRRHAPTPVIMVTAVGSDTQRISSLLYGADDYVIKPYNPSEVVARVHAVLRRWLGHALSAAGRLRHGQLVLDIDAALAYIEVNADDDNKQIPLDLTRTEFHLLSLLMAAPSTMFSRSKLLATCLPESDAMERVMDVHIYNLRRKLELAGITDVLVTVRGLGYRFRNPT